MREDLDRGVRLSTATLVLGFVVSTIALGFGQSTFSSDQQTSKVMVSVTDRSGAVIKGAEVTFKGSEVVAGLTGQSGSVRLTMPHGRYTVTVVHSGFKTRQIVGFSIDTAAQLSLPVVLTAGGDGDPVELDLDDVVITSDLPNTLDENLLPAINSQGGDLGLVERLPDTNGQTVTVMNSSHVNDEVMVKATLQRKATQFVCFTDAPYCSEPEPGEYRMVQATSEADAPYQDCTDVVLYKPSSAGSGKVGVYCWLGSGDCYFQAPCSPLHVEILAVPIQRAVPVLPIPEALPPVQHPYP